MPNSKNAIIDIALLDAVRTKEAETFTACLNDVVQRYMQYPTIKGKVPATEDMIREGLLYNLKVSLELSGETEVGEWLEQELANEEFSARPSM